MTQGSDISWFNPSFPGLCMEYGDRWEKKGNVVVLWESGTIHQLGLVPLQHGRAGKMWALTKSVQPATLHLSLERQRGRYTGQKKWSWKNKNVNRKVRDNVFIFLREESFCFEVAGLCIHVRQSAWNPTGSPHNTEALCDIHKQLYKQ